MYIVTMSEQMASPTIKNVSFIFIYNSNEQI